MGARRYLLIFDCDGVLVDTEPTSNRVLARAITAAGLPMQAEEVADLFEGMRLADIQAEVEKRRESRLPKDWRANFEAERAAAFEQGLDPIPGIAEVLARAAAAGTPMCVASQARREKTELTPPDGTQPLLPPGLSLLFDDGRARKAASRPLPLRRRGNGFRAG